MGIFIVAACLVHFCFNYHPVLTPERRENPETEDWRLENGRPDAMHRWKALARTLHTTHDTKQAAQQWPIWRDPSIPKPRPGLIHHPFAIITTDREVLQAPMQRKLCDAAMQPVVTTTN